MCYQARVRLFGFVVMMLGVVTLAAGMITGCNATVNYNGRHVVAEYPLVIPTTLVHRERRAERLIGPYAAPSDRKVNLAVDLSEDPKSTEIEGVRVVLYDDAKPRSLAVGFSAAALGVVTFLLGGVVVLRGGRRHRRKKLV